MAGTLKIKDPTTGTWINAYKTGPRGPVGNPAVMVGEFGATKVPADLPVDGNIPVDWDDAGDPAHQMVPGEALIFYPTDIYDAKFGHVFSFVGPLNPAGWVDGGRLVGPQGPSGVSSIIIGDFGAATTPADLPPSGLLPVDWDGVGNPAVAYQMNVGESLYYEKPTDPLDGHLFQYIGVNTDPTGWLDIGLIQGPPGPVGPLGPIGPMGPTSEEVWVGVDEPDPVALPDAELWFDPDDTSSLPTAAYPPGGGIDQALVKATAVDNDVKWGGPFLAQTAADLLYLMLSGGTLTGNLTITGNGIVTGTLTVNGDGAVNNLAVAGDIVANTSLTVPTIKGDVYFNDSISVNSIEDRSGVYAWEVWDAEANLAPNWGNSDFQGGQFPGVCKVFRNRYTVIVMMGVHLTPGFWQEDVWMDVIVPGSLPVGFRPAFDLWDTRMSVETDESGSLFEIRITNTGSIMVNMKGLTLDWQDDTRIPINFSFPRSS